MPPQTHPSWAHQPGRRKQHASSPEPVPCNTAAGGFGECGGLSGEPPGLGIPLVGTGR